MKKIPAILLSLLLLFSLAACTDGGEAEPTELGARNAYRAAVLAETVFEDYYNEDTGIAPEKLPETDGVDIASVWDYVTMMSLADRMIDVDGENARWTELRDSLYAFLPYYGQFRTDEWTDVPYASRRGDREFWSTATMTYDDQIWIIREFLNTYEKTENAEYLKLKRVNEAKEQIAMFEAMYAEYILNPEITRSRMYYEMIEQVLPGVKVFIDTSEGGVQKLLPLDSLIGQ